jgi:hypothetical protein
MACKSSIGALGRFTISSFEKSKMGFSSADVARALNLTPSAESKLICRARSAPDLINEVNGVLNTL